jgi:23S rRNA (adenine2503-C2)-methyltransferase
MNDIMSKNIAELEKIMEDYGESKFRAKQIFEWLHKKMVFDYQLMSNVPKKLLEELQRDYPVDTMKIVKKYESEIDGTIKYLFELKDSHIIESVLMRYKHGNSVCISTQVGCHMNCAFCASTLEGLVRNLTPGEMVSQIYHIAKDTGEKITHVVMMGSGEPLERLDYTCKFIELINCDKGQNIGQRHITLSTCGLVPNIIELANKKLQVTLAVSLHASDDEKRKKIMPIAKKYSIKQLLDACRYYTDTTGRRITFEYALIDQENDTPEDAKRLGNLLKGMLCHVNLIPVNSIEERNYKGSHKTSIDRFIKILEQDYNIDTTLRRRLGADIDAACGQLRRRYVAKRGE